MSLINDMLRDLDQRKSAYPQQQGVVEGVRVTAAANSQERVFARRWLWLVAIVGVVFLAAFVWHLYGELERKVLHGSEQLAEIDPIGDEAAELAAPQLVPAPSAAFTEILAVEVRAVPGGARIEISLSAPVQHRVLRNGQQLIIDLPATRLAEALPNLTRHPLISAVDVLTHATGMQLEVDVTRPVNLQTSMVSKQQTLLVVELITASEQQTPLSDVTEKSVPGKNQNVVVDVEQTDNSGASFEKTSRQLTLAERDQQANRQALQQMANGRSQAAQQLLTQLLAEYPQAHQSRASLIAMMLSLGQLEQAQQQLAQGLQLAPEQLAFIKLKARILLTQQRPAEAAAQLEMHQQQGEQDQEFLALLASAAQRDGQHQRAASLYQQLLQQNDWQAQWWIGLAISLEALNQKSAALKAYWQARELPGISPALKSYAEGRINQLK